LRWTSDVIERRHSMPGIEPGALKLSLKPLRPPLVEDKRSASVHRNWVGQRDLHPHRRRHRARCCYYIMANMNWSLWSDSHRRIQVYKTRPVAAEAQRQNGVHGRNRTCGLHLRTVAL